MAIVVNCQGNMENFVHSEEVIESNGAYQVTATVNLSLNTVWRGTGNQNIICTGAIAEVNNPSPVLGYAIAKGRCNGDISPRVIAPSEPPKPLSLTD